jgi:hypothetical protein
LALVTDATGAGRPKQLNTPMKHLRNNKKRPARSDQQPAGASHQCLGGSLALAVALSLAQPWRLQAEHWRAKGQGYAWRNTSSGRLHRHEKLAGVIPVLLVKHEHCLPSLGASRLRAPYILAELSILPSLRYLPQETSYESSEPRCLPCWLRTAELAPC